MGGIHILARAKRWNSDRCGYRYQRSNRQFLRRPSLQQRLLSFTLRRTALISNQDRSKPPCPPQDCPPPCFKDNIADLGSVPNYSGSLRKEQKSRNRTENNACRKLIGEKSRNSPTSPNEIYAHLDKTKCWVGIPCSKDSISRVITCFKDNIADFGSALNYFCSLC